MKKNVLDIGDLQQMYPFFKTWLGKPVGKAILHMVGMDKVNKIHANHYRLRGAAFTTAMLNDPMMDVHYEVYHRDVLERLPQGAFITVSNHPIGSLDGIILIDIFATIRPDFKVMVNDILSHITAMGDNFISVVPKTDKESTANTSVNTNGIRASLQQLHEGHPMGFFPAGAMSFYDKSQGKVHDLPWTRSVVRLIRKASVPVIPVYFDCLNSKWFYFLGRINWKIRILRVAKEAFNKKGKTLHVHLGEPIPPEKIKQYSDDEELANFLYDATYALGG